MANNKKIDQKKKTSNKTQSPIEIIKANEKKYTIFLVTFFFLIFCFIGYKTLQIHNNYTITPETYNKYYKNEVSLTGTIITLTKKDIKNDTEGINSPDFLFNINNTKNYDVDYQIILEEDEDLIKKCGCANKRIPLTSIRYSLDGKKVKKFNLDKAILLEDTIPKNTNKDIKLKIWLAESLDSNTENHFHGHLKIEII